MTTVDFYAKTFPILYPCLENSTTGNAILKIMHSADLKMNGCEILCLLFLLSITQQLNIFIRAVIGSNFLRDKSSKYRLRFTSHRKNFTFQFCKTFVSVSMARGKSERIKRIHFAVSLGHKLMISKFVQKLWCVFAI